MMDFLFWLDITRDVCHFRRMNTKRVSEEYFEKNIWPSYEQYEQKVFENGSLANVITRVDGTSKTQRILQIALRTMGMEYEIMDGKDEWFENERNSRANEQSKGTCCCVLL